MKKIRMLSCITAMLLMLSGCNQSPVMTSDTSVTSPAETTVTTENTLYSYVDLPPVYTTTTTTEPKIWPGNDGILIERDEFDYPLILFPDSYDNMIDFNHIQTFKASSSSRTRHSLAEPVLIADAPAYSLASMGMTDDTISFSLSNKSDSSFVFDFECLAINNIQLIKDEPDGSNIFCTTPESITVNPGETFDFDIDFIIPNMFNKITFTDLVFKYDINGRLFYGRIFADEDDNYDGHIYSELHKTYKPINYAYRCGDIVFTKDGMYAYHSDIEFVYDTEDLYQLDFKLGLINNDFHERRVCMRFISINDEIIDKSDAIDFKMQPCCFSMVDMSAYFGKHINEVNSFTLEVLVDGKSSTVNVTLSEPIRSPYPAETVVTTVPPEEDVTT